MKFEELYPFKVFIDTRVSVVVIQSILFASILLSWILNYVQYRYK